MFTIYVWSQSLSGFSRCLYLRVEIGRYGPLVLSQSLSGFSRCLCPPLSGPRRCSGWIGSQSLSGFGRRLYYVDAEARMVITGSQSLSGFGG